METNHVFGVTHILYCYYDSTVLMIFYQL